MLINNEFAAENQMLPRPVTVIMKVAGGDSKRLNANIFEFELVERDGTCHSVWAYGVDSIVDSEDLIDPSPLQSLFPHISKDVFRKLEKRRVDLLIGLNYNGLFPTGGTGKNCVDNLRVMKTRFGKTGWILGGSHPSLKPCCPHLSVDATRILTAARLQCVPEVLLSSPADPPDLTVLKLKMEPELSYDFWSRDNLAILPPRRCSKCRQCAEKGTCSEKHLIHTLEEETDLKAIEENIQIVDGVVRVSYPFKKDPSCLPFNRNTAVSIASKL